MDAMTTSLYYGPRDLCSDADREKIAQRLRDAHVDGRLDADELSTRLELALAARTYGDLERSLRGLLRV
jgi:hypothetical protein